VVWWIAVLAVKEDKRLIACGVPGARILWNLYRQYSLGGLGSIKAIQPMLSDPRPHTSRRLNRPSCTARWQSSRSKQRNGKAWQRPKTTR
jgi:hypothetical protein